MTPIKTITGLPVDPKRLEREEASKRVRQSQSDSSQEQKSPENGHIIRDSNYLFRYTDEMVRFVRK